MDTEGSIRIAIRMARSSDAAKVARIYVDSWRETYAGILPEAGLLNMSKLQHTSSWARSIKSSTLRSPVLVASDEKANVYGFASAGPARDRTLPFDGEVYTLYIAPGWTGQGLGSSLLRAIMRLLGRANYNGLIIWALAANPSRFFYEAMGGKLVAERQHPVWGSTQLECGYGWTTLDRN